jgi:hypothetical protein
VVTATSAGGTASATTANTAAISGIVPANTVLPVITGTNTLAVSDGTWVGTTPLTFAYQWQRGTTNISGATSNTYALVDADIASTIRCVVTATNAVSSASVNTANTAPIEGIVATGGTVTIVDGHKIHTFTSAGEATFEITSAVTGAEAEYLIVAGGGTTNQAGGGGGGAGGVLYGSLAVAVASQAINVGFGRRGSGNGYPYGGTSAAGTAATGTNSTVVVLGTTYTAFTGGVGTGYDFPSVPGGSGGSGGGAGNNNSSSEIAAGGLATQTTQGALTGYGNNGGAGGNIGNEAPYPAGGGGGASAAGVAATSSRGGAGGAGIANPIAGSTIGELVEGVYYIGGGGSGADDNNFNLRGIGGGGTNARSNPNDASSYPTAALPNTGGGGGGGSRNWGSSDGGSGVVIIRYPVLV